MVVLAVGVGGTPALLADRYLGSRERVVLPGLIQHVLLPSARCGCDVFVHATDGGAGDKDLDAGADGRAVATLRDAAAALAARVDRPAPAVVLLPADAVAFDAKYCDLVVRCCTAADPGTGKPQYFPWVDRAFTS